MTTPAPTAPTQGTTTTGPRRGPTAAVLLAETRLFLREPGSLFWILAFPPSSW